MALPSTHVPFVPSAGNSTPLAPQQRLPLTIITTTTTPPRVVVLVRRHSCPPRRRHKLRPGRRRPAPSSHVPQRQPQQPEHQHHQQRHVDGNGRAEDGVRRDAAPKRLRAQLPPLRARGADVLIVDGREKCRLLLVGNAGPGLFVIEIRSATFHIIPLLVYMSCWGV